MISTLKSAYRRIHVFLYHHFFLKRMINKVRNKNRIKVVFALNDLPVWKTERLYLEMKKNPQIEPILGISKSLQTEGNETVLVQYCKAKDYSFVMLDIGKTIVSQLAPDVIVYQKPYGGIYPKKHSFYANTKSLFIYVGYAYRGVIAKWNTNLPLHKYCWQNYYENEMIAEVSRPLMSYPESIIVTGTPFMDELMTPKECFVNPWRSSASQKRIIYAPHHTIGDMHAEGIAYSTFLENGEFMLAMAKKFKSKVHFAFKPHPLLINNLYKIWGKDKTDNYYAEWQSMENAQFENGVYVGLFKHSDAMIHDCASFMVEYLYTGNPVMFLMREDNGDDIRSKFTQECLNLHYVAWSHSDIENFILDVIDGKDPMKKKRASFYEECLCPPHGKSACQNIINAILGKEEYQ